MMVLASLIRVLLVGIAINGVYGGVCGASEQDPNPRPKAGACDLALSLSGELEEAIQKQVIAWRAYHSFEARSLAASLEGFLERAASAPLWQRSGILRQALAEWERHGSSPFITDEEAIHRWIDINQRRGSLRTRPLPADFDVVVDQMRRRPLLGDELFVRANGAGVYRDGANNLKAVVTHVFPDGTLTLQTPTGALFSLNTQVTDPRYFTPVPSPWRMAAYLMNLEAAFEQRFLALLERKGVRAPVDIDVDLFLELFSQFLERTGRSTHWVSLVPGGQALFVEAPSQDDANQEGIHSRPMLIYPADIRNQKATLVWKRMKALVFRDALGNTNFWSRGAAGMEEGSFEEDSPNGLEGFLDPALYETGSPEVLLMRSNASQHLSVWAQEAAMAMSPREGSGGWVVYFKVPSLLAAGEIFANVLHAATMGALRRQGQSLGGSLGVNQQYLMCNDKTALLPDNGFSSENGRIKGRSRLRRDIEMRRSLSDALGAKGWDSILTIEFQDEQAGFDAFEGLRHELKLRVRKRRSPFVKPAAGPKLVSG